MCLSFGVDAESVQAVYFPWLRGFCAERGGLIEFFLSDSLERGDVVDEALRVCHDRGVVDFSVRDVEVGDGMNDAVEVVGVGDRLLFSFVRVSEDVLSRGMDVDDDLSRLLVFYGHVCFVARVRGWVMVNTASAAGLALFDRAKSWLGILAGLAPDERIRDEARRCLSRVRVDVEVSEASSSFHRLRFPFLDELDNDDDDDDAGEPARRCEICREVLERSGMLASGMAKAQKEACALAARLSAARLEHRAEVLKLQNALAESRLAGLAVARRARLLEEKKKIHCV